MPLLRIFRKRTAILPWLLAATAVMFPMSQHTLGGIILCLGADGHVELEHGSSGDCAIVGNSAAVDVHFGYELVQTDRNSVDCGPCVDITVLNNVVDGQVGVAAGSHTPVVAVATSEKTQLHRRDLFAAVSTVGPARTAFGLVLETTSVILLI